MKKRNYNLVFIRFLAIIIVMFGHSIIIYDSNWGLYTSIYSSNLLVFIKHIINYIQMPIWFGLSGYLYYFSIKKKEHFKVVFLKKLKKLIIPFFMIGLFYFMPIRYIINYENFVNNSLTYNIWHNLILGFDNGHLWFLPTLFFIFLIFFFDKVNNKCLDFITFIILLFFNMMSYKFSTYLLNISFYSLFFFIGILFNKYNLKASNRVYYLFILLIILIVYNILSSNNILNLNSIPNLNSIILTLVQVISLIVIFKIDYTKLAKINIINSISENSYGMYLFHSPIIYFTFKYLPNINPLFVIFINFIIFGFISYFLTHIIRKTKLKFIIGE
jgi:fucose 4-O-acetylase-like acetyltransferase